MPSQYSANSQQAEHRPRVGGDELFVPAPHVLVTDHRLSHAAFRLWCLLHRLWFLRKSPTMDVLQELMGSNITNKETKRETWQPATRRSVERWLGELEEAGWLSWNRRSESSERYHLHTSARSADDAAILTQLRSLINSGNVTLADIQALLQSDDATPESHDATLGSHARAVGWGNATPESHDATLGSHDATPESHDATLGSHHVLADGVLTPRNQAPYREIMREETHVDLIPPPPATNAAIGGDGGGTATGELDYQSTVDREQGDNGLTDTERFLLREGFSSRAAREFREFDLTATQADFVRRREIGQGIGAIVNGWRAEPPEIPTSQPATDTIPWIAKRASEAKSLALSIAPPDADEIEIQYLALDLEDNYEPDQALKRLHERRQAAGGGR